MQLLRMMRTHVFFMSLIGISAAITPSGPAFIAVPEKRGRSQVSFPISDCKNAINRNHIVWGSRLDAAVQQVDRVSICMGELCKCQEEGDNAESIMTDLQSRNVPFIVEDAPCLGACGLGAMVSIEYENGDYNLVCGLEETLEAIGLRKNDEMDLNETGGKGDEQREIKQDTGDSSSSRNSNIICDETPPEPMNELQGEIIPLSETIETISGYDTNNIEKRTQQKLSIEESTSNEIDSSHDAVKRMRAQLVIEEEEEERIINPWLNMAMYIGKKVTDSAFK